MARAQSRQRVSALFRTLTLAAVISCSVAAKAAEHWMCGAGVDGLAPEVPEFAKTLNPPPGSARPKNLPLPPGVTVGGNNTHALTLDWKGAGLLKHGDKPAGILEDPHAHHGRELQATSCQPYTANGVWSGQPPSALFSCISFCHEGVMRCLEYGLIDPQRAGATEGKDTARYSWLLLGRHCFRQHAPGPG